MCSGFRPPSLVVFALLTAACGTSSPRTTIRVIDGKPQASRYVSPTAYEHYLRARLALQRGDAAVATYQLRAALVFDERSPLLHTELAALLARQRRVAAAHRHLAAALRHNPQFPDALLLLGDLQRREGKRRLALASYRRAIAAAPRRPDGYLRAAELLEGSRPARARRLLRLLVKRTSSSLGHRRLALFCLRRVDYRCAAAALRPLVKRTTRPPLRSLVRLARVERALGNDDAAVKLLREAFDRSGGSPRVAGALATTLARSGKARALDDLLAVIARQARGEAEQTAWLADLMLDLDRPAAALRLLGSAPAAGRLAAIRAEALYRQGQEKAAKGQLRVLLRQRGDAETALRLARLLLREGRAKGASAVLAATWKRHPDNLGLLEALSHALFAAGKRTRSIEVVKQAVARWPADRRGRLQLALALALERAGHWQRAVALVKRAAPRMADRAAADNFIGYTLAHRNKQLDAAERHIRRALQRRPDAAHIVDSLGWLHFRRGRLGRALKVLTIAWRLAPRDPQIGAHLAEVHARLKHRSTAVKLLRQAIARSDDQIQRRRWQRRLQRWLQPRIGTR